MTSYFLIKIIAILSSNSEADNSGNAQLICCYRRAATVDAENSGQF